MNQSCMRSEFGTFHDVFLSKKNKVYIINFYKMMIKTTSLYDYAKIALYMITWTWRKNTGWHVLGFQSWLLGIVEIRQRKRELSKIVKEKWET